MIELSNYLCGGYFLTRPAKREDWQSSFLPDSLLSLSRCVCDFVPDAWTIEWTGMDENIRLENASKFDLKPEALIELKQWSTANFGEDFDAWYVMFQLETAQYLRKRFLSHLNDVVILGAGLHKTLCDDFLKSAKAPPSKPGFAPNGESSDYLAIAKKLSPVPGGIPIGFEPVNRGVIAYDHSWVCNSLEKDAKEMKITINEFGLISEYADALKFTNLINEGKISAEPDPWWPWLLVDYSKLNG